MNWRRIRTAATIARLALLYAAFLLLRRVVALERLTRWAWVAPTAPRDHAAERRLAAQVSRLSRLVHARADCMPRSLVLYRELSRRSADPQLVVGFARRRESLVGHAWVVVDGVPVDETHELLASLTGVCTFGARGRLLDPR